jgi:tetratricopeptide (TPR) repeat protein
MEAAMRAAFALWVLAMAALGTSVAAHATASQDWCFGKGERTADQQIEGCSAAIGSGQLSPQNTSAAFNNRGNGFMRKQQIDRALQDYDQAIRINPANALALRNRADAYRIKGRYDRAIEDYDQSIRLNATAAPAFFGRALALYAKALGDFDAVLAGDLYFDRAIQDADQAIRLASDVANYYKVRGDLYRLKRRHDVALKDYDKAISLNASFAPAYFARALTFRHMRQPDRAIADYRAALSLKIDDGLRKAIEANLKDLGAPV